ncbi:MAG: ABC transporter substrate-binding protein, partial [Deltaproteobacteria bacterium]|nr:ABC transporter substrate-binding protein [Deltaproteobacteria bacterium]
RAPHPNAAKVFINWYLSRQGQTAVTRINKGNSRRLDVPVVTPETQITLEESRTLFLKDLEENAAYAKKAAKVAKEILR